jgi:hypothetical protein
MTVKVHLLSQSQAMVFENVINAYTKDGLYCILKSDKTVSKFPLCNIFRIDET